MQIIPFRPVARQDCLSTRGFWVKSRESVPAGKGVLLGNKGVIVGRKGVWLTITPFRLGQTPFLLGSKGVWLGNKGVVVGRKEVWPSRKGVLPSCKGVQTGWAGAAPTVFPAAWREFLSIPGGIRANKALSGVSRVARKQDRNSAAKTGVQPSAEFCLSPQKARVILMTACICRAQHG